jgi:hypothetical protein
MIYIIFNIYILLKIYYKKYIIKNILLKIYYKKYIKNTLV